MAQNSSFLDEIDCEATEVRPDAYLQKSLPGIGISLKTTQIFITIVWELYSLVLKPICEEFIFPVSKISKSSSASLCFLQRPPHLI